MLIFLEVTAVTANLDILDPTVRQVNCKSFNDGLQGYKRLVEEPTRKLRNKTTKIFNVIYHKSSPRPKSPVSVDLVALEVTAVNVRQVILVATGK